MERSALARSFKPIARQGFVVVSLGENRRTRLAKLAASGMRKLDQALPVSNRVRDKLVVKLGPDQTALMVQVLANTRAALDDPH
jgi:hypothetical protein